MSRVDAIFADLRGNTRAALMPFVTGGHPSIEALPEILRAMQSGGASIVEIGFPFSDPIADGPVIASSMHESLKRGITPEKVFQAIESARPALSIGLIAMVSMSIVHRMGTVSFLDRAAKAGIDGLIVPDIDLEDAQVLSAAAGNRGMSFSMLTAPTTSPQRLKLLLPLCRGFVYVLARTGITGESKLADGIESRIRELRSLTSLPLAVGFGISKAADVAAVTRCADAAIVGSAMVRRIGEAANPAGAAGAFTAELAQGLAKPS